MQTLSIAYVPIDTLHEYKKNAKKHPKEQVQQIAQSIAQFGMNDPIAVDENNVIIEGHGRLMAIQKLHQEGKYGDTVPVIRLLGLTEQQKKAYILVHNQLTMDTGFDIDLLNEELSSIDEFDMTDFGFLDAEQAELERQLAKEQSKQEYANLKLDILNLEKAQFPGTGPYDIPELQKTTKLPKITRWVGFNEVLSDTKPKNHTGVHFFIDDYQFERIWNRPDDYIPQLKKYACVTSPDFSPYGDMPLITQLWNHYRKHWVGCYMQQHGITVIPTIRASTDPRSLKWFLDGEPKDSIVIVSSMYKDHTEEEKQYSQRFWDTIKKEIHPIKVLIYGEPVDGWDGVPTETIPTYTSRYRERQEEG